MPDTLTPKQQARLEAEVVPLERAAYQHEQLGELEDSFRLKRDALAREEAIVGPCHQYLAEDVHWLANGLRDDKQYEEAEALYLRALSVYEMLYGTDNPEIANALFDLGYLYDEWDHYEMSLPVYSRALELEERIYGEGSLEVARTCMWLSDAHRTLGQYAQAEPYLRRALGIWSTRRALDDGRMLTLTQERLAGTLFRLKRYAEALTVYDDVLALNNGKFHWKHSRRRFNRCRVKCLPAMEAVMQGG